MKQAIKRKLIQAAAFGFGNAHLPNFISGKLYRGKGKYLCAPGLNCYSCPAASFACPIGAMQAAAGDRRFSIGFYALGTVLAFGVIFGRAVCGFLCPFGLLQELLYKLPLPKRRLPKILSFIKFIILAVFVLLLPAIPGAGGIGSPAFCKYICPAGTLEGGLPALLTQPAVRKALGFLFTWKMLLLLVTAALSIFFHRFFCRVLCPLGAIYGLCNKVSLYRLKVDAESCISCGRCASVCLMEADPVSNPDAIECIRCGACAEACPKGAIQIGFYSGKGRAEKVSFRR